MSAFNDMDFGSESDEGDFNPGPEIRSDDEDADERQPSKPEKKSSKRPSPAPRSDLDEDEDNDGQDIGHDDEDDEDEDEDEEDEVSGRPRKRTRRDQRNQFIDEEAEVDEDDEEGDEDDEAEAAGFIAEDHQDDLGDLPAGAETDDRRHRELDRKREQELQMDAEKQAALLKERYGRSRATATDTALVPKRLLLPSVDDPSIWAVKCKPGKEREAVMSITKRIEERRFTRNPLPIISALERGGTMAGYIYIETRRQADIIPALDGIMNVYARTKIVIVPIKEMPDLLRVRKTESLQPGGYVRIRRGKYQGDLAQIDDVESNGLEVTLKIVPRLDYGLHDDLNAPVENGHGEKRKRPIGFNIKTRPPQRLFNEAEAKKKQGRSLVTQSNLASRKVFQFFGEDYVNGYLIKDFKINHLQTEDINPTLGEVTRFASGGEDGNENLDLAALAASLKANTSGDSYLPGDMVEVFEGEQQGVSGKAVAVRGDIVTISVYDGELKGQRIEVPIKGLRKRFKEGDHVKVIGGSRFRDEVGLVVRIKDDQITIVSDLSMQEITVFGKDLRVASDSGVAGGLGRYDIHDLVQLDPSTVGCVIKVDRESLRVLDQNGSAKTVMPSQISNKIEKRKHAVATDRNGSEIRHDDTVREMGGDSKQGVIIHIHRSFLFLLNREQTENSGIFVVRASNVATIAAKGGRVTQQGSSGPDLTKMNPAVQRNGTSNGSMLPPRTMGRDRIIGQTVKIRKGPYKGLLGIVKDATDTDARVELHTKNKVVSITKEILGVQDPLSGNSIPYSEFSARGRGSGMRGGYGGGYGGATPSRQPHEFSGSRTPIAAAANGGRTPAWGSSSRTPAWNSGGNTGGTWGSSSLASRTSAYGRESVMNGGRTPGWGAGGDGGKTPYGGSGGRTPAWESGSRTAYGGNAVPDGFGGGKTPAYESSRTPAYTSSGFHNSNQDPWAKPHDAPTPGGLTASTPSNLYSAPTPAASAPTPSGYGAMDAPTPATGAPTPFSGNPDTPAWGGEDDDGPRYDDSPSP